MKFKITMVSLLLFKLLFSTSCASANEKQLLKLVALPENFIPVYEIVRVSDKSYINIRRATASITMPAGLSKTDIENNLKHAVLQIYKEEEQDAIMVFGYKDGDDTSQAYTLGSAEFAPYGQWGEASHSTPLKYFRITINLRDCSLRYCDPEEMIKFCQKYKTAKGCK